VAIYQASQAIVELCDKVMVLYEGRGIFFGRPSSALEYFEKMGWHRPTRQTTGNFLTAITNPEQRETKPGFERLVPRTAKEFEGRWRESQHYSALQAEMNQYRDGRSAVGDAAVRDFQQSRAAIKGKWMLPRAPQTVTLLTQTKLCTRRAYQQLRNDPASTAMALAGEVILALVVGSMFYDTPVTTAAFFAQGSVLFFSVLLNVLMAMTDCHGMYKGRSIIRKQVSYAFYRPSADALATVLVDIPVKFGLAVFFNIVLYFMAGLAVTAGQFFIFFLVVFVTTLAMSMIFRTIAAATTTLPQAMAISGFSVLVLATYTGFVLPGPYMHPWFKWISWLNPLAYAFEALLVNQAHGTDYPCTSLVPPYPDSAGDTFICPIPGATIGQTHVNGDSWFEAGYGYSYCHLWRNVGVIAAFFVFFLLTYLLATELNMSSSADPDVPVFLRGRTGRHLTTRHRSNIEAGAADHGASTSASAPRAAPVSTTRRETFSWQNVCLDIKIGDEPRRLLDNVSGWVRPGTLTALMGVSGAGKTTLLNALAHRSPSGTTSGEFNVDGTPVPPSFTGEVGYVQQQDVHLETCTVREALQFSATLRQSRTVPAKEKLAFAEELLWLLQMDEFADAVIGTPGRGLTLEQRKRVSIGVELAARPAQLLFLDEPTSGLDGQSSAAILALLRRLAGNGLGILCTIHQPSAMLFQEFDRVLLMAAGGKTVYFGEVGKDSETVVRYFGDRGARTIAGAENPADYVLNIIGSTAPGPETETRDWPRLWSESTESKDVSAELVRLKNTCHEHTAASATGTSQLRHGVAGCPMPLLLQMPPVYRRVFRFYWRSPSYVLSKFGLAVLASLVVGFSFFQPGASIQGIQNAIFGVLMVCAMFSALVQQVTTKPLLCRETSKLTRYQQTIPKFILQRTIYEVRERHSRTYSWAALAMANILVEMLYNIILGVVSFGIFNYTVFGVRSPGDQGLVLLFFIYFYVFAGTFAHMVAAPLPDATTAGRATTILFSMILLFAGVVQSPQALPGFWVFMYRVSPMTYLVGGTAVTGLSGVPIVCSPGELAVFQPPQGKACGPYLEPYLQDGALGTLLSPEAIANCSYCPLRSADQVLARLGMYYDWRWADWAVGFAFIAFNVAGVFFFYHFFRVRESWKWVRKASEKLRKLGR